MIYIKAFLYKEFCELKSSKNSILLLIFLTLIPLIASFNDPLAFIEFDLQIKYLLCLVPFAVSGQLSLNLIENEKMPIPRKLSSNCGIGVSFNYDGDLEEIHSDDMEKIFSSSKGEYKLLKEF